MMGKRRRRQMNDEGGEGRTIIRIINTTFLRDDSGRRRFWEDSMKKTSKQEDYGKMAAFTTKYSAYRLYLPSARTLFSPVAFHPLERTLLPFTHLDFNPAICIFLLPSPYHPSTTSASPLSSVSSFCLHTTLTCDPPTTKTPSLQSVSSFCSHTTFTCHPSTSPLSSVSSFCPPTFRHTCQSSFTSTLLLLYILFLLSPDTKLTCQP